MNYLTISFNNKSSEVIYIKKRRKIFKIIALSLIILLLVYSSFYIVARLMSKLPIQSANSFYMYDKDNHLFEGMNEDWIPLSEISPNLINATISIEDKHFYSHVGFDYLRIIKALFTNLTSKKTIEGASTITQQFAKNLFLDFDRNLNRKLDEAFLTMRLETHYSKDEILEGYLNTINYGGVFGIENASIYYFGKKAKDLSLAEATILAGIPKSPANYSPISNYKKAKKRQKLILNSMVKNNYISETDANIAYQEKLNFKTEENKNTSKLLKYYQDAVMKELETTNIPSSFLETGGLKIYTNLDMNALNILEKNIDIYLQDTDLQIAGVIMDPNTGEIKAIAGGKDYSKSEYNRVISSKRQMGSSFKPILYYAALENGFTPSTTFSSEKTTFNLGGGKKYSPKNYGDIYANKEISLAAALAYSDNIYAVKTNIFLDENTLVDMAKRLGITSKLEANPSLALGTNEVGILEMMQVYSTFANEGYQVTPHFINKIEDINGNILYEFNEKKKSILNKSIVFVLNELLTGSYANELIDYNYPTCIGIRDKMTKKYAIKTGTTNTDHLIFGYNKDLLIGMWLGYDDNQNTEVKDGNTLKNIWVNTMEEYLKGKPDNWYEVPSNVVGVLINPITGELSNDSDKNKRIVYYIKGTQPLSESLEATIAPLTNQE